MKSNLKPDKSEYGKTSGITHVTTS